MPIPEEAASPVCIAHLVRQLNGVEPLRRFLAAYRCCPGGLAHDFLLLCKGFEGNRLPAEYLDALGNLRPRTVFLDDSGFDIEPYFAAVRETDYAIYCFLNSFSAPLDPEWLRKLHACLQTPGVALAGATASWGSMASHAEMALGLPSAYDGFFGPDAFRGPPPPPAAGTLRQRLGTLKNRWSERRQFHAWRRWFAPFPSCHIRSNAFILRRETMQRARRGAIRTKLDAMRFESGHHSLTAQVLADGGSVRLVGRDGVGYEPARWPESGTFWQDEQENLLVADNQTLNYANADPERRRFYAHWAWGDRARVTAVED